MRPGFALSLAILLVLLLSAAALGMVAVGITEVQLAGAATRRVEARVRAESLARTLFREWSTRAVADLDSGRGRALLGAEGAVAGVERVDTTLYLIRTEARVPPGGAAPAIGRAALLVRVFDPGRTVRAFPAAATVDGPARVTEGLVDGRDRCGSGNALPGLVARSVEMGPTAVIEGSPPVLLEAPAAPPAPDPLAPPLIGAIATLGPRVATVTPRPMSAGGACIDHPRNWGALDPAHPCHSRLPVVFTSHDLTLSGGEARAVLVVEGDLRLVGSSTFGGIIVVRDTLTVESGSVIEGAVRAGALLVRGGAVRANACTVAAAASAPVLDAGYRPAHRWWVPSF